MNTDAATTVLFQFISLIWPTIMTPTASNAEAVTDEVNNDNNKGEINIDNKNKIPVTMAAKPVLPPIATPVALSTKAVTVLEPKIEPTIPPMASLRNAFSIPFAFPSSSTKPHSFPTVINVPVVSKNVTNNNEKTIIIKSGIFENNCPNPLRNPPNNDVSILKVTICSGMEGINTLPAPYPNSVNITPITAVASMPKNTAAGTFRTENIKVIITPINAMIVGGVKSVPIETNVDELGTIIPQFLSPKNAKKNPIPTPMPNFKSLGRIFNILSLKPEIVIIKNIMLETNTAARAVSHVFPISSMMVYVNNAFRPIPGASPTGYLATRPIIMQAIPDESAVEKNTAVVGIPPSASIEGLTPKI